MRATKSSAGDGYSPHMRKKVVHKTGLRNEFVSQGPNGLNLNRQTSFFEICLLSEFDIMLTQIFAFDSRTKCDFRKCKMEMYELCGLKFYLI